MTGKGMGNSNPNNKNSLSDEYSNNSAPASTGIGTVAAATLASQ